MRRILFLVLSFLCLGLVDSSETYEDAQAKFAIDLPSGFKLKQHKDLAYDFVNDKGEGITLVVAQTDQAIAEVYATAVNQKIFGRKTEIRHDDTAVNGYRAHWGVAQHEVKTATSTLVMVSYVGAVKMGRTIVTFISFVPHPDPDRLGDSFEKAFRTIRRPASYATPKPSTWTHPAVTVDLPAGWAADPPDPGSAKESVAVFSSESSGARMNLICHPKKKAVDLLKAGGEAARKLLKAAVFEPKRTEKTASGQDLLIELFSYTRNIDDEPTEEVMYSVASDGHGCGLLFTGLVPKAKLVAALRDMETIVKSAR